MEWQRSPQYEANREQLKRYFKEFLYRILYYLGRHYGVYHSFTKVVLTKVHTYMIQGFILNGLYLMV